MDFGAVGNGTTDDAAAVNAAIAASHAQAAAGGRLGPPVIIDRAYAVASPIFLQSAPLVADGKRGEINAVAGFTGGKHVIRNWLESDYVGAEDRTKPPAAGDYTNHYFVLDGLRVGCGGDAGVTDLNGISLCAVHETSILQNLTFSAPGTSGAGLGSVGFHLSGTTGQGINGKVGLDNFTFYGVGWKNEIKVGESDTSVSGSEVTINRWTSGPGVHQGSCIDIGIQKVTLNDFHIECYVDPALAADTDLATIRCHNVAGFSIYGSNTQINPTSLILKHPAIYTSNTHGSGSAISSPVIVNLTQTASSGSGWDPAVPWIKDRSNAINIMDIPWAAGTQNPTQINYYDGNIYSRNHPSTGVTTVSLKTTPSATKMTRVAVQSIPNNVLTAISFDTIGFEYTDDYWNVASPTLVTIPSTGWYRVTGGISFASNATGLRKLWLLRHSGSGNGYMAKDTRPAVSGDVTGLQVSYVYQFVGTDYVQLMAFQDSGAALDVEGNSGLDRNHAWIHVERISD